MDYSIYEQDNNARGWLSL